jgi:hypothetical protein
MTWAGMGGIAERRCESAAWRLARHARPKQEFNGSTSGVSLELGFVAESADILNFFRRLASSPFPRTSGNLPEEHSLWTVNTVSNVSKTPQQGT